MGTTKIYCDGVSGAGQILDVLHNYPQIAGFTTNPSLMRKAGVEDYAAWAKGLVKVTNLPISFEVVADEPYEIARQARLISAWGRNVYVKVPVVDTKGITLCPLIHDLSHDGVKVNVTAVMTTQQVLDARNAVRGGAPSNISIFAGRIADTGYDPKPAMQTYLLYVGPASEIIWASPREVFNYYQARSIHCPIITMSPDLLAKLKLDNKPLDEYSVETVQMFYEDACMAGYTL